MDKKANKFKRPEPRNGLKNWQKTEGDVTISFPPHRQKTIKLGTYTRSGLPYATTIPVDADPKDGSVQRINHNLATLSDFQNQHPEIPILVNSKGEIAKVGEDCWISQVVMLGRNGGYNMG